MKRARLTLAVFVLMNFVVSMTATVFGGILDQVALALKVPVASAGLLNTAYSFGAALGVPLVLITLRNVARDRLLRLMLLLTILSTLSLVLAQSFQTMLILRFLMGLAVNSYGALGMSMAVTLAGQERQGRALALYIMGNSLGLVIGVPLTRLLSSVLDWRGVFWILAGLMLLSLLYFQFFLPRSKEKPQRLNLRHELRYLANPGTLLILLFTLFMFMGSGGFYIYLTPYLLELFPSLDPAMSLVLMLLGLSALLGNLVGGMVSDRIGYAKSMLLGGLLQLGCALALLLAQGAMLPSVLFSLLWLMSVWFTGLQPNAGIVQQTQNQSSFMLSLNGSAVQLGYALGSSIAALIITGAGIARILLLPLSAAALICVLLALALRRSARSA